MSDKTSGRDGSFTSTSVSSVDCSCTPLVGGASSVLARLRFAACELVESSSAGGVAVPFIGNAGMVLAKPGKMLSRGLRGAALEVGVYRGQERGGGGAEAVKIGTHDKGLAVWRVLPAVLASFDA
jgi:hypothetical protein